MGRGVTTCVGFTGYLEGVCFRFVVVYDPSSSACLLSLRGLALAVLYGFAFVDCVSHFNSNLYLIHSCDFAE